MRTAFLLLPGLGTCLLAEPFRSYLEPWAYNNLCVVMERLPSDWKVQVLTAHIAAKSPLEHILPPR